jgi:hypothetical protein
MQLGRLGRASGGRLGTAWGGGQVAAAGRRRRRPDLDVWVVPVPEDGVQRLPYAAAVLRLVLAHGACEEQQLACAAGQAGRRRLDAHLQHQPACLFRRC